MGVNRRRKRRSKTLRKQCLHWIVCLSEWMSKCCWSYCFIEIDCVSSPPTSFSIHFKLIALFVCNSAYDHVYYVSIRTAWNIWVSLSDPKMYIVCNEELQTYFREIVALWPYSILFCMFRIQHKGLKIMILLCFLL